MAQRLHNFSTLSKRLRQCQGIETGRGSEVFSNGKLISLSLIQDDLLHAYWRSSRFLPFKLAMRTRGSTQIGVGKFRSFPRQEGGQNLEPEILLIPIAIGAQLCSQLFFEPLPFYLEPDDLLVQRGRQVVLAADSTRWSAPFDLQSTGCLGIVVCERRTTRYERRTMTQTNPSVPVAAVRC